MKIPPSITVQLIHLHGPMKGQIQDFTESPITIGRQPGCSIQFPKDMSTISRIHAEILREGNRFKVVDKSANGTFVNGKKVIETYLKDGDVIMFTEGGPKVSFLATITEAEAETAKASAPQQVFQSPPTAPEPRAAMPEMPMPIPSPEPPKAEPPAPAPTQQASAPFSVSATADKVQVPLIIQYGPTLRSYKELPVTLGKNPSSDFAIDHPSVMDTHAQILFSQGSYRIRDLTGRSLISVNGKPVEFEAALKTDDLIFLSQKGPAFRFLGEGRLAEHEETPLEDNPPEPLIKPIPQKEEKPKGLKGFMDFFKK